ncbi:lipid IV(A) 3-deoxy-D-manno-octulosonic acid transferase [Leeia oryzae]|uniref:lipid IV(A) 3-deoxy-D-manno-octulosonic acid transferase n=1 Tax=Leeia oryzae TaxID=356662 RepID=UPI00035E3CD2|nr:lipid IV(A) 3-deoxy-D-manno-octulosonic acid transferase [Leeia oryzae]
MWRRFVYTACWFLLLPVIPLRLWWRGRKEPGYKRFIAERFGVYRTSEPQQPVIWLHAVSLGETRAAQPLVDKLREHYPAYHLVITHMTATGRQAAESLYGEFATIVTLPYDYPFAMRRFLRHFQPALGLIMETEIWPNMCHAAAVAHVPLFLVNARLSERSALRYRKWHKLIGPALCRFSAIAAQGQADAERFAALGAQHVHVCGNLKFDLTPPVTQLMLGQQLAAWLGKRPVFLFASSREGEEQLLLTHWVRHRIARQALLVIVPRHPQRFDEVALLMTDAGLNWSRRSSADLAVPLGADINAVLGDSMGEMYAWYAASQLALIGGSMLPLGGQNLIEAAAAGCPTLLGPHMFNFAEAAQLAVASEAAREVLDMEDALSTASVLLSEPEHLASMREAGLTFTRQHRGAAERVVQILPALPPHLGRITP